MCQCFKRTSPCYIFFNVSYKQQHTTSVRFKIVVCHTNIHKLPQVLLFLFFHNSKLTCSQLLSNIYRNLTDYITYTMISLKSNELTHSFRCSISAKAHRIVRSRLCECAPVFPEFNGLVKIDWKIFL